MVWNPFGPTGLWSNQHEVHITIMAVVTSLVVIALDRRGHPRLATLALFVSFLASMGLWSRGIEYKAWYFAGPVALLAGVYLIYDRRDRPRRE